MLWQIYYNMWFDLHQAPRTPENEAKAREWADYLRHYNRTPNHYELSVHHHG